MCVFVALWASKGVAGFMRTRERVSKGGGGFIWAQKSSPCGAVSSRKREIVRPARLKHPKFGVFVLAGRVFSRKGRWRGRAGRVFSRRLALCRSWKQRGALQTGGGGGFAPCEALWRRVAGVSEPWMASFPPVGGGTTATSGGVAAKVQTHWTKVAENGLFWLNGTALWRICCLSWCVVRTQTRY